MADDSDETRREPLEPTDFFLRETSLSPREQDLIARFRELKELFKSIQDTEYSLAQIDVALTSDPKVGKLSAEELVLLSALHSRRDLVIGVASPDPEFGAREAWRTGISLMQVDPWPTKHVLGYPNGPREQSLVEFSGLTKSENGTVRDKNHPDQQDDNRNPEEDISSEDAGDLPMTEKMQIKLQRIFDRWSQQFASLHEEAELAIAEHDIIEHELEFAMEKRRVQAAARSL